MSLRQNLPLIFAHRGANRIFAENTLPAFEAAIQLGAQAIECDLTLDADNSIHIFHDDHLRRMTASRTENISEMHAHEIKQVTVRAPKSSSKNMKTSLSYSNSMTIPSLNDFFGFIANIQHDSVCHKDICLNLEIKKSCFRSQKIAQDLLNNIEKLRKKHGIKAEQILLSSFDWRFIDLARFMLPKIKRGLLIEDKLSSPPLSSYAKLKKKYHCYSIHPSLRSLKLGQWLSRCSIFGRHPHPMSLACHALDIQVIPYTVNSSILANVLFKWGHFDGIFSDTLFANDTINR